MIQHVTMVIYRVSQKKGVRNGKKGVRNCQINYTSLHNLTTKYFDQF